MINRQDFFRRLRSSLFQGKLGAQKVEGVEAILRCFERESLSHDKRHLAYILATAHHETGGRFQPIREWGGNAYLTRNYDITGERPRLARANGNALAGDGIRYAGRGFVQLTWRNNYRNIGRKIGIDLEQSPHLALASDVAALILVRGMQEGWFTGKRLSQYFNATTEDWDNARRIVNGRDKAATIAGYGRTFLVALHAATVATAVVEPMKAGRRKKVISAVRSTLQKKLRQTPQVQHDPLLIQIGDSGS